MLRNTFIFFYCYCLICLGAPIPNEILDIESNAVTAALLLLPTTKRTMASSSMDTTKYDDEWLFQKIAEAARKGGGPIGGACFSYFFRKDFVNFFLKESISTKYQIVILGQFY